MRCRKHAHGLDRDQRVFLDAGIVDRLAGDADIGLLGADQLLDAVIMADGDGEADVRPGPGEVGEDGRQHAAGDAFGHGDAERIVSAVADMGHRRQHLLGRRDHALDLRLQAVGIGRRHQATALAEEQCEAQRLLELGDLLADRRLRDLQAPGRGGRRSAGHHRAEGLQLAKTDVLVGHSDPLSPYRPGNSVAPVSPGTDDPSTRLAAQLLGDYGTSWASHSASSPSANP